jgi:hypothetical protein
MATEQSKTGTRIRDQAMAVVCFLKLAPNWLYDCLAK